MESTTALFYHFPSGVHLDRRSGKYTFASNANTVLVVNAHEPASLEDLELLYHPFLPRELSSPDEMFDADVLEIVLEQRRKHEAENPPAPEPAPKPTVVAEAPPEEVTPPEPAPPPRDPAAPPGKGFRVLEASGPPPARRVSNVKAEYHGKMHALLARDGGVEEVFRGRFDEEIGGLVQSLCDQTRPRNVLIGQGVGKRDSESQVSLDKAAATQAFGTQLAMDGPELFVLAKSAILQTLSKTGYKQNVEIKQHLLLHGPSQSLEYKLSRYYDEVVLFLRQRKTDEAIVQAVADSKFIYLSSPTDYLDPRAVSLAVADAFLVLKQASQSTVEVLDVLPTRLRATLPPSQVEIAEVTEKLLVDCCYNEFRQPIAAHTDGGDHCDFFRLGQGRWGIAIFDVSGHEERAAGIRNQLVEVFNRLHEREDPGRILTLLNRFCLKFPLPMDVFVSMIYGVLDAKANTFLYANAGHHPPYLLRRDRIVELDRVESLALNIMDEEYEAAEVEIEPLDCLVFYTDGLIEAVCQHENHEPEGHKRLFGKDRLRHALHQRQIAKRRANEAVDLILAAAQDGGFVIEDDITVQVYRHV